MTSVAIIGGYWLKSLDSLVESHTTQVNTPYGAPSTHLMYGQLGGHEIIFLPRRQPEVPVAPHDINFRANIWALRDAGATHIISTTTVASLNPAIEVGDIVIPSQLIDYTHGRPHTYFGDEHTMAHIQFAEPFSTAMQSDVTKLLKSASVPFHNDLTIGVSQGPRQETKAEIKCIQRDGCDIVGMTVMPEAALARELSLEYLSLGLVVRKAAGCESHPHETISTVAPDSQNTLINTITQYLEVLSRQ